MSAIVTNPMTGEVSFKLGGTDMRVHATMPRLAEFQAAMGVQGLGALMRAVTVSDAKALYLGLRSLCTSGNASVADTMLLAPHLQLLTEAITAALMAGLPEASPGKQQAEGR